MSVRPQEYYDRFSESYDDRRHYGYHALIDTIEVSAISGSAHSRLLDAGCGTGLIMERLRLREAPALYGVDLSRRMLKRASHRGFVVGQASLTALPFADSTFDVAYSFKVLPHILDVRTALAEMTRVVKPGGTLVVEFYNRRSIRGMRWWLKRVVGGEFTSAAQRETELFTRYDTLTEVLGYLPANTRLVSVRGAIVVTPAAVAMQIPGLSTVLTSIERRISATKLARYAGFIILILKRL